jgi:two-component sensor histidine kinase
VRRIGKLYDPGGAHTARFNVAPLVLPGSRAALLGQIVVELAMNVYRHAFAGRTAGTIAVDLTTAGEDEAVLVVADDGPGLPEDVLRRKHFGLTIVEGLAEELGGSFGCANHDGLVARVRFPLDHS